MNPSEFDNIARLEREFWWYRGMDAIFASLLDRHIGTPGRLLDAGCGTGRAAAWLQSRYKCRVDCLDIEALGLRYAGARGLASRVQGDVRGLPLASGSYDGVVSLDALVHLPRGDEAAAVAEFCRVLKPGGLLAVRVAALDLLHSRHSEFIGEKQRFRRSRLRRLGQAAGLETIAATYANALLLPVALVKFRLVEPLMGGTPASGVEPLPPLLNRALEAVLDMERAWLSRGGGFPAGQSILWFARRPA